MFLWRNQVAGVSSPPFCKHHSWTSIFSQKQIVKSDKNIMNKKEKMEFMFREVMGIQIMDFLDHCNGCGF